MKKALPSGTADFEVLKTKPRNPVSSDSFILKFVRKNPDKNRIDPFFWVNISIANALCHAGRWFFVRQFFRETRSRPRLHRIPFRKTLILQKLPENLQPISPQNYHIQHSLSRAAPGIQRWFFEVWLKDLSGKALHLQLRKKQ